MKHSLLLLAAAAGLLVSCSKNNNDNNPPVVNPPAGSIKMKTYTEDGSTINYTYDAQGRLLTTVYPNGSKSEYDYSNPNKVIKTYYFADGSLEGSADMDLNAAGLVVKKVFSDGPPNLYTFEYDTERRITKRVATVNGSVSVRDYFYTNGSLDSIRLKTDGNYERTILFTYYTNKTNVLDSDSYGQGYEGYLGKYLVKKEVNRLANGSETAIDYNYEFDAKGRVTKLISNYGQNVHIGNYTYY